MNSSVLARLDYCNSIIHGTTTSISAQTSTSTEYNCKSYKSHAHISTYHLNTTTEELAAKYKEMSDEIISNDFQSPA